MRIENFSLNSEKMLRSVLIDNTMEEKFKGCFHPHGGRFTEHFMELYKSSFSAEENYCGVDIQNTLINEMKSTLKELYCREDWLLRKRNEDFGICSIVLIIKNQDNYNIARTILTAIDNKCKNITGYSFNSSSQYSIARVLIRQNMNEWTIVNEYECHDENFPISEENLVSVLTTFIETQE